MQVLSNYKLLLKRKVFDSLVNDYCWRLVPSFFKKNKHFSFRRKDFLTRRDRNSIDLYFKDLTVINGIFKGLKYYQKKSFGSAFYPKLIGSYEVEIQANLKNLLEVNCYKNVIDIGCAEGYYLAGIGLNWTKPHLYGVDISEEALLLTKRLLLYNNIQETRFTLSNSFNDQVINPEDKNLFIIDCEGFELEFFKNFKMNIKSCDFLIECHDFLIPSITDTLVSLLNLTHNTRIIYSTNDELKFNHLPHGLILNNYHEKLKLVCEERGRIMHWIIARSRSF